MVLVDDGQDRRSTPYCRLQPLNVLFQVGLVPSCPSCRIPAAQRFPISHATTACVPSPFSAPVPGSPRPYPCPPNVTATPHARTPRPFPALQDLRKPWILLPASTHRGRYDCPLIARSRDSGPGWAGSAEAILCWALEPGSPFDTDCGCRGPLF